MVRLGTWMPFSPAAEMLSHFTKVDLSESTARRITERAGQAYVEVQAAQLEVLERELPDAPEGPAVELVSVDGAMVPLVHKDWQEVRTLAIGNVAEPVLEKGELVVHTQDLSYFSRLADHETFARQATVEIHRRGTENAGIVCAVVDGADWEQKFIDLHCVGAVRILDWAHAAGYVAKVAQAVFGSGTADTSQWLGVQLHELKHGDPQKVLGEVRCLRDQGSVEGEALRTVAGSLEYLEKRKEQIRYAEFLAAGYPIGSGAVESANKLVVEARLKGAGMHWAREQVNPMVALRTIACSDRWEEAWPQICERLRQQNAEQAEQRRLARRESRLIDVDVLVEATMEAEPTRQSAERPKEAKVRIAPIQAADKPVKRPWVPSSDHPWRRMHVGRAQSRRIPAAGSAET
jgi:hypothetical protein